VNVVKTEHGLPEPGHGVIGAAKARLNHSLDRWATRRLRMRVCYVTADIMGRYDRQHHGLERRVVHNGIEPLQREGRPRPAALEPGRFHVGIVGRVSRVKGISTALRAMTSDCVPDRVRLNIIGSGPLEQEHCAEAQALGLGDRVCFHGFQRDVLDWMAHLDLLLMPSLHEGLPYTLLEAMSLGLPIMASRVGGLAELLRDGETGLLVDVGDADRVATLLAELATGRVSGTAIGARAARAQRDSWTLSRMVDRYLDAYAGVSTQSE